MARLEDYRFGRVTVDDHQHTRDVIVLPDRVVECLRTDAAVRRCGELDERRTAAALHLTC